ncbi:MAG: D-alanyl-D-alanine carboxypeptidase family protein [Faecousia sp.]
MKKMKHLSFLLCVMLLLQCVLLPVSASQTEETSAPQATASTQASQEPAAFGTVCVQSGCRTIEGMVPLGGSDKRLETCQSAFLYEVNTDTVVYSFNPDMKLHPGTLAKIVLAMVVLENCELDDVVTVTEGIQSYVPGTAQTVSEKLKSNEHISVRDLLYATLMMNANDCAVALAHHVAGTTDAFLTLMNSWAKRAGCNNTEFGNISGLYTAQSYSTARDMAKIMREAMKNEDFQEISSTRTYTIEATDLAASRKLTTQNYMVDDSTIQDFYDSRVTGGLASYHESTGASIVCTAESKGMTYIAVVLGALRTVGENGWSVVYYGNFNEMTDLLKYGFDNFKVNRIVYDGMAMGQFSVAGGECNAVGQAVVNIDSVVPINAQMNNLITSFTVTGKGLSAPIDEGQLIATAQVKYRDSVMAEAEVYAVSRVKASSDTGVTIYSSGQGNTGKSSGILSTIGTILVVVVGLVAAYLAFNSFMRSRMRAIRRKRRAERRRNR